MKKQVHPLGGKWTKPTRFLGVCWCRGWGDGGVDKQKELPPGEGVEGKPTGQSHISGFYVSSDAHYRCRF